MRTRSGSITLAALGVLFALPAFAAGPTVDLTSGSLNAMVGTTLGIARSLLPFCLVLGLLLEAFGSAPSVPRDYGSVVWRFVLVLVALTSVGGGSVYGKTAGTVIELAEGIAARIAPASQRDELSKKMEARMTELLDQKAKGRSEAEKRAGVGVMEKWAADTAAELGGAMFNTLMSLIVLLGQISHWVITTLGRILAVLFFVIGPLAIVFSVPRGFGFAGSWLRTFVTYCCWPIFSALILRIAVTVGLERVSVDEASGTLSAMAASLLLVATAVSVPALASALIGSAASDLASQGVSNLTGKARSMGRFGADAGAAVAGRVSGNAAGAVAGSGSAAARGRVPPASNS